MRRSTRFAFTPSGATSGAAAPVDGPADHGPELADVARLARRGVRLLVRAARADEQPGLQRLLREHLGPVGDDVDVVEETWAAYEHVNVQRGLDAWLAEPGRTATLVGIVGFHHRPFGLGELVAPTGPLEMMGLRPGTVARVNVPCGPDGATQACVVCGLYLVTDGPHRLAVLLRGPEPESGNEHTSVQVLGPAGETARTVAAALRRHATEHNAFRGQVLSFGGEVFGPRQALVTFHSRPRLDADGLVLPPQTVAAVRRQVVGVAAHKDRLLEAGQHLKRGLLLYGPPGVGKTHTVRHLVSALTGTTVIQLTGAALHLIGEACSMARALQPSMLVVEDVDLIAQDRGDFPGQHPLLFQLLNEMDGLAEDADVVFVLTTNRADILEPALAARPGRVDQAIELELPDAAARRALVELYRGRLVLDTSRLDEVIELTEGVTASFLKELLRRAALVAAERQAPRAGDGGGTAGRGDGAGGRGALQVSATDLRSALDELLDTRNAMTRVLLGAAPPAGPASAGPSGAGPSGAGPVSPGWADGGPPWPDPGTGPPWPDGGDGRDGEPWP